VLDGVTDDSARLQAALNAHRHVVVDGIAALSTGLTMNVANSTLEFTHTGGIVYSTPTLVALTVSAANCRVIGGTITAPATFDATNNLPQYSTIRVTANDCDITSVAMVNVPKVGIEFREVNGGSVRNCRINGGTPSSIFTSSETGHAGILVDVSSTEPQGDFIISGNRIQACVQGILFGNFTAGDGEKQYVVSGNTLRNCWNHGIYASSPTGNGIAVSGNSLVRCQIPIAVTGKNHSVTGNVITTLGTGTGADRTGISMRNSQGCVVVGNTIKGEIVDGTAAVSLTTTASGYDILNNIIANNVINITSGNGAGIQVKTTTGAMRDNIIDNNYVRCGGALYAGIIEVVSTATSLGTRVTNNTLVHTGIGGGISINNANHSVISGNSIRLEADSASALIVGAIYLASAANTQVTDNKICNTADWGTNIAYRGIWEGTGVSNSYIAGNQLIYDMTKLASIYPYLMLSGSGSIVHGHGGAAPTIPCQPGSTWRNTAGGVGTSFYVKESANTLATWQAK
jgi:hypothetical protein